MAVVASLFVFYAICFTSRRASFVILSSSSTSASSVADVRRSRVHLPMELCLSGAPACSSPLRDEACVEVLGGLSAVFHRQFRLVVPSAAACTERSISASQPPLGGLQGLELKDTLRLCQLPWTAVSHKGSAAVRKGFEKKKGEGGLDKTQPGADKQSKLDGPSRCRYKKQAKEQGKIPHLVAHVSCNSESEADRGVLAVVLLVSAAVESRSWYELG